MDLIPIFKVCARQQGFEEGGGGGDFVDKMRHRRRFAGPLWCKPNIRRGLDRYSRTLMDLQITDGGGIEVDGRLPGERRNPKENQVGGLAVSRQRQESWVRIKYILTGT